MIGNLASGYFPLATAISRKLRESARRRTNTSIVFEGSYEITPFFQRDINSLRAVSPRFVFILLLTLGILGFPAELTAIVPRIANHGGQHGEANSNAWDLYAHPNCFALCSGHRVAWDNPAHCTDGASVVGCVVRIPPFVLDQVGSPLAARSLAFVDDQYLAASTWLATPAERDFYTHRNCNDDHSRGRGCCWDHNCAACPNSSAVD